MKYQTEPSYCGTAVVVNVLRAFGRRVSWRSVAAVAGTTVDNGTDEKGIINALRTYGLKVDPEYQENKARLAWTWLQGALLQGKCVVLGVDNHDHWITAIAAARDRIVVIDSTRTQANISENGVHVLSRSSVLRRWKAKDGVVYFYGISVGQ